jgi:hypothetical protein
LFDKGNKIIDCFLATWREKAVNADATAQGYAPRHPLINLMKNSNRKNWVERFFWE